MTAGGRELDRTPTWAVASVCGAIILISILMEKGLHHLGEVFTERRKKAMYEALEKIKDELMILGFISLLLTFWQNYIVQICIPEKAANSMLPCHLEEEEEPEENVQAGKQHRKLLWGSIVRNFSRNRMLEEALPTAECSHGKVPLISLHGLHQLHIFIFFLAVFHVFYSAITMKLGREKIRSWKEWEKETASPNYNFSDDPAKFRFSHETSFVRRHSSGWNELPVLFYLVSFFRQFFRSVRKVDYLAMRHGFITVHLAPGSQFNFQKYIKRTLEDDFKMVVGISPILWASAVIYLLLDVKGWLTLFWISVIPLVIILSVGTKLQAIITKMAIEIKERHAVVQGIPLVQLSDQHFWFGRPEFVLFLIHLTLFQNAFQLIYMLWIWYEFGWNSCFQDDETLTIARIFLGILVQVLCSYSTLPLYALVSQMGSHLKKSIFDDQTSKAIMKWHHNVKKKSQKEPNDSPQAGAGRAPTHNLKSTGGDTQQNPTKQQDDQRTKKGVDAEAQVSAATAASQTEDGSTQQQPDGAEHKKEDDSPSSMNLQRIDFSS